MMFWAARFAVVRAVVDRARERGELREGVNALAAVQIVMAPLNIRALYSDAVIDDDYCAAIADLAWHALRREPHVNSTGSAAGERKAIPTTRGGGALGSSRKSGSRSSSALIATVASMRARCMPRHRCGPPPNVRCAMCLRVGSKRSGSG